MNKKDIYYPSADGETKIHAIVWEPDGKPKAVVQIIHGMLEYINRYDAFARYLTEHGYLVCGEDHLGHGESVRSDEYHGYFGQEGNTWVIQDINNLRFRIHFEYPDIPYMMLGHSMGSFLVRQYITGNDGKNSDGLAGVIVMGTAWQPAAALKTGKALASMMSSKPGERSKALEVLAFGSYLKRIDNPKTISDWLTRNDEVIANYRKDPWCSYHFSPNAFYHMFAGMEKAHDVKRMKKLPAGLPILFASGAEDPVGNWGEGVRKAYTVYKENTDCEVDIILYDDDRHEILNELDKDQVYEDMLAFFEHCYEKATKES